MSRTGSGSNRMVAAAVAMAVACAALAATPAAALGEDAVGYADAATLPAAGGEAVGLGPRAACDVHGVSSNSASATTVPGVVSFGDATSRCTLNRATQEIKAEVSGTGFRLEAFEVRPRHHIEIDRYEAACTGTRAGGTGRTRATWRLDGVRNLEVPSVIVENTSVWADGTLHGQPAKLLAVFNETLRDPSTGAVEANALHLYLYKADGRRVGDAALGRVACQPY